MQTTELVWALALAVSFLSPFSAALQCYQCTSSEELQCGETLRAGSTIEATDCSDLYDAKYCVKMSGVFEGELGTKRWCSSTDMGNFCEYITRPGDPREYRSCVYTCNTDGCNGASSLSFSIIGAVCLTLSVIYLS